jgi:hypothetical protein
MSVNQFWSAQRHFARRTWVLIAFLLFVTLFTATADQPFHLDNMDFPAVAKATASTGLPVYYRGEENPHHIGLYHPPLYIYTLAGWILLFGFGEVQVRMFGFACLVLNASIVIRIVSTLLGRRYGTSMMPWFLPLLFLNPYSLQTASIADIDSTIYGPILCGIVLFVLRMSWRDGHARTDRIHPLEYIALAVLSGLALWAKITTVLLLFFILPLLMLGRPGSRRTAFLGVASIAGGVALFGLSYWLFGIITNLDVTYSLRFTLDSFVHRGSSGGQGAAARIRDFVNNFKAMAPTLIIWTGIVPWIAAAGSAAAALWVALRTRSRLHVHIGITLTLPLVTTAYYCGQTLTFGAAPFKYTLVYWPIIVAAPVFLFFIFRKSVDRLGGWWTVVGAIVYVVFVWFGANLVKDDLVLVHTADRLDKALWCLPAVLAFGAVTMWFIRSWVATGLVALSFVIQGGLALGVAMHQAGVEYSTTYDYGQVGFLDTVAYLRTHTDAGSVILSMKDIGFKADRLYIENYAALYGGSEAENRVKDAIRSGTVAYAVFTEGKGQDQLIMKPHLKMWIEENCRLKASFGHYRLYEPMVTRHKPLAQAVSSPVRATR